MQIRSLNEKGAGVLSTLVLNFPECFEVVSEPKPEPKPTQTSAVLNDETTIIGAATRSVAALNAFLKHKGCPEYAEIFKAEGEKLGIAWDLVIFQACLETGFWRFGGDVKREQNNFFGIGATGGGVAGDVFATPDRGISAQMQNLALRAGVKIPLADVIANHCRRNYGIISRRNTPRWAQLAGTYAMDEKYWDKIKAIAKEFDGFAQAPAPMPAPAQGDVLLDPGHSEKHVGARGNDPRVEEENLTRLQAAVVQKKLAPGIVADIFDPEDDILEQIGNKAAGYKAFVSLHLNKYSGDKDPGIEVFVADDSPRSLELAQKILIAVVRATGETNRGVKHAGFTVIKTAAKHCPAVLVESFFLNPYNQTEAEQKAELAAGAIADAIKSFIGG